MESLKISKSKNSHWRQWTQGKETKLKMQQNYNIEDPFVDSFGIALIKICQKLPELSRNAQLPGTVLFNSYSTKT